MQERLSKSSLLNGIRQYWYAAVQPSPSLKDVELRHRARLLNSLLIVFAPIAIIILFLQLVVFPSANLLSDTTPIAILMGLAVVLLLYVINHTKFAAIASYLAIGIGYIAIIVNAIASTPPHIEITYLVLLPLFSTLLFPFAGTLLISVVNIVCIAVFVAVMGDVPSDMRQDFIALAVVIQTFLLFASQHRNRLETDRQHSVVEQEKVRILADFIRNISHEFRTALSVINTGLYLIKVSPDPESREDRIVGLNDQVSYLTELLEAMLTMTRLDSQEQLITVPCDLNKIVRDVITDSELDIQNKHLTLQVDIQANFPLIWGDVDELHMALKHILKNAIDFTPEDGKVTVRTFSRRRAVMVEVEDTGVGISEKDQAHIFERFYRVDQARSTRGAGLGLAIAHKIIEDHDGTIELDTILGEGSTFSITLPLRLLPVPGHG